MFQENEISVAYSRLQQCGHGLTYGNNGMIGVVRDWLHLFYYAITLLDII